jgi:hypothetical protein
MAGRPPTYDNAEQLQAMTDEYFKSLADSKEPATITGLAYFLGFESRQSFYDYQNSEEFSYTIKRARLRIEQTYEAKLSGNSAAGPIFALKNLGWSDKSEQEVTHKGVVVNFVPAPGCEPIADE